VATAQTLVVQLHRLGHIFERYERLRGAVAAPERTDVVEPPLRLTEGVRVEGVTFRYADAPQPALSDVDLLLAAGSTVAIVGENGAGKTTLVKLLCRFYEPERGRILVDGVDLPRFAAHAWRERISACFQDFARFEFRVREGVGFGDLPRLDEDAALLGALRHADAQDLVTKLPGGLETPLGRSHGDGSELSGGQWQKLALSRSMMRTAPLLLILDEPASALDPEAEHALFERYVANARRLGRDTGTITVFTSHRFSTVRKADMIIVVGGGGILDVGSHDALMARDGLYANLFRLQAQAYA
jgi:ATP-binding cassette subfamily B protein